MGNLWKAVIKDRLHRNLPMGETLKGYSHWPSAFSFAMSQIDVFNPFHGKHVFATKRQMEWNIRKISDLGAYCE